MWWLKLPLMVLLLMMAWQDWKYRAISIWLFLFVGICLSMLKYQCQGWFALFEDFKVNICFLVLQFIFLFGYFAIKERKFVNLFSGYFGEGDLLFLILLSIYFSFINFLLFYILSLLIVVFMGIYIRKSNPKIPLAGAQALCLVIALLIDQMLPSITFTKDFLMTSPLL